MPKSWGLTVLVQEGHVASSELAFQVCIQPQCWHAPLLLSHLTALFANDHIGGMRLHRISCKVS